MAIDKAVDSATLDSGLKYIANAIREKTGRDLTISFPDGFAGEIASIQTANLQDKSVTPTLEEQKITPDEDHNGLASVTVAGIPLESVLNDAGGLTLIIGEGGEGSGSGSILA